MILVVDDHPSSRRVVELTLKTAGHEVMSVASASEAVGILATREFQLVITDLVMPGVNGVGLFKMIQVKWPQIPVILISGSVPSNAERAIFDRAVAFLEKPIMPTDLLAAVERALSKPISRA